MRRRTLASDSSAGACVTLMESPGSTPSNLQAVSDKATSSSAIRSSPSIWKSGAWTSSPPAETTTCELGDLAGGDVRHVGLTLLRTQATARPPTYSITVSSDPADDDSNHDNDNIGGELAADVPYLLDTGFSRSNGHSADNYGKTVWAELDLYKLDQDLTGPVRARITLSRWLATPTTTSMLTLLVSVYGIKLGYEWTHYLVHSDYRPRSRWFRSVWRNHRLHHYKNEHYWFTVTTAGTADRLFGTYPDPASVKTSGEMPAAAPCAQSSTTWMPSSRCGRLARRCTT